MKFLNLLLIILLSSLLNQIYAQISGVINQYTHVIDISCAHAKVMDNSFLSPGDKVLIIQMRGVDINTANNASFGTVLDYRSCGLYEFATVSAISVSDVLFQNQLMNTYEANGNYLQLIRVPQYTNVTVTGPLTAQPWDGYTGGVLALEVSGTLTLNAPISLNGKGFRGSYSSMNPDGGCGNYTDYSYAVSSGFGALKGEGIADIGNAGGRGACANGGGGGNKHNTGGGGGSPDYNDGVGSPGGNGGGIILIKAAAIQSNNTYIESCGENVVLVPNTMGDGGGGGGAGGTIALDVNSFSGQLTLRVDGGDGGSIQTTYPSCFGPGGGGGTGAIQISGSVLPAANVTTSFVPGDAGINLSNNSSCAQSSYGAAAGMLGPIYSFNLPFPESNVSPGAFDMGPDIEVCESSLIITTNVQADSYLWSTGETTGYAHANTSGLYWLSVQINAGDCWMTDTIMVNLNSLSVDAGPDQAICEGAEVLLNASSGSDVSLTWNNNVVNNQPFSPQTTAEYVVTATSSNGICTATDTVLVTVSPFPDVAIIPSVTSGCAPLTVLFNHTGTDCASGTWTFSNGTVISGCGNQSVTFDSPGCYDLSLEVTSVGGCTASSGFDSIICVSASPTALFSPVPAILNDENSTTTMVNNSIGGNQYEWNFGDNTVSTLFDPVHSYSPDSFGSYPISLTVTNENGCSDVAYGIVYVEGGSSYYVPNAFTPDGNEFNQVFRPVFAVGIDRNDYNFKVFNRWGEIVFESNDTEVGWDGTYHDQLAQEGVYTWRIEFKSVYSSEKAIIHGHVGLLK